MSDEFRLSALGQIAMNARDIERATTFYRDALGLPFLFSAPPGLAFFDLAGIRLMLSTAEAPEHDHPGSVLYFTVPDIARAHRELAGRGVRFEDEPHPIADLGDRVLWMAFFRDTEGNLLALMSEVAKNVSAPRDTEARSAPSRP